MKSQLCIDVQQAVDFFLKDSFKLIDIRDQCSFGISHVDGSLNIPFFCLEKLSILKNIFMPIMIICYHGISSQYIALYLRHKGFQKVYSVNGGFKAWSLLFPYLIKNN